VQVIGGAGTVTSYVSPTTAVQVVSTSTTSQNNVVYTGYCSTLIANGPNNPTTAQGHCGTILVLNAAGVRCIDWRLPALIVGFYGVLGLCGLSGFKR
jgi:hypothetical protein